MRTLTDDEKASFERDGVVHVRAAVDESWVARMLSAVDRVLATRFGGKAVELVKRAEYGTMVAFAPPDIVARRLEDVVGRIKTVPLDSDLLLTARALGVTFGD